MQFSYHKFQLTFTSPVLTSRGSMAYKNGYLIQAKLANGYTAIGECSFIEGLSIDDLEKYEFILDKLCLRLIALFEKKIPIKELNNALEDLELIQKYPSIQFGLEMLWQNMQHKKKFLYYPSLFTENKIEIPINGLVWMGDRSFMLSQIKAKLAAGFRCIKLKVGALDFATELDLLHFIRTRFDEKTIEIRLDANGAFDADYAAEKLEKLAAFHIHSIEQPIKPGQWDKMRLLIEKKIIPIALDEELIGIYDEKKMQELLINVNPEYIILKPSLIGGFLQAEKWIKTAQQLNKMWWATSALESNYGLSAIAEWVATKENNLVQGLGTGGLYTDNFDSPLYIKSGRIGFKSGFEK